MKSVDKLREWANGLSGVWIDTEDNSIVFTTGEDIPPSMDSVNLRDHFNGILDGIEREVEERYMPLPVDADGVPIRMWDVMEESNGDTFTVIGIGSRILFYERGKRVEWAGAYRLRHHHAPTVEDVLWEFAGRMSDVGDYEVSEDGIIAEYADRLRWLGVDE